MVESAAQNPGVASRAGDDALLEALRSEGFQGPAWDRFAEDMARYALPFVTTWIASQKIFAKCSEKGVRCPGALHGSQRLTDDDAGEMTNEIIARALNRFRDKVLRPGVWSSQGGAKLTTMFLTQCIFQFPNVYRHWLLETKRLPADDLERLEFLEAPGGDPAGLVMIQAEVAHALEHYVKDERVRVGLVLRAMGFNTQESAEMIGTTARALDSAFQRHWKARGLGRGPADGEEGETVP